MELHAVQVVGYDNSREAWLVKNSWGSSWGDKGYFWVAYFAAGICPPSDTWGWSFQPSKGRPDLMQRLKPWPGQSSCLEYTSQPGDHMAGVSYKYDLPLHRLLLDNLAATQQPHELRPGTRLKLCNLASQVVALSSTERQAAALLDLKQALVGDAAGALPDWQPSPAADAGEYCQWRGVRCADGTKEVQSLLLERAGLSGTLPSGSVLSGLPNLEEINIRYNPGLTGTLPSDWDLCPQLRGIFLYNNALVGALPPSWGRLSKLVWLGLQNNQLTGPLPPSWRNMSVLEELVLRSNQFNGTLPASWGGMTSLRTLELWVNALTGTLPPSWAAMTQLRRWTVGFNKLTGKFQARAWMAGDQPCNTARRVLVAEPSALHQATHQVCSTCCPCTLLCILCVV